MFSIHDSENNEGKPKDCNINTEVRIQGNIKEEKQFLLGLLDTGATGTFIKRSALKNFTHQIRKVKLQAKGRYALSNLQEMASFTISLPDFSSNRSIDVEAYVEDDVVGRHDIILGIRVIHQLGLVFDFQRQTVTWDDIVLPMLKKGTIHQSELAMVNPNETAPEIIQKALH
jgi:hypothetical protein